MHIQSEAAPGSVLIKPGVKNLRGLLDYIETATGKALDKEHVRMMNPLVLAYIGDTVYDLFVRTYLIHVHDVPVHQLHIKSISYHIWLNINSIFESISTPSILAK